MRYTISLSFALFFLLSCQLNRPYSPKGLTKLEDADLIKIAEDSFSLDKSIVIRDSLGKRMDKTYFKKILDGQVGADFYGNKDKKIKEIVIRSSTYHDELLMIQLLEEHQFAKLQFPKIEIDCAESMAILEDLFLRDQSIRGGQIKYKVELYGDVDQVNLTILLNLLDQCGFLPFDSLSEDAKYGMFSVLQHAPHIQSHFYYYYKQLTDAGLFPIENFILLTDRMLVMHGKEQVYGSQLLNVGGYYKLDDIRDFKNLDKRRASIGLEPMEDYLKRNMAKN